SYLKRGPLKSSFRISKPDKIWTEVNVLLLTVCVLNYFRAFPAFGREIYIWGYVLVDSYDIFQYLLRLSFDLILLIPSLFLFIRKVCLGIGKETSFIWRQVWQYQKRTSLEKQFQHKFRIFLAAGGILTAGILWLTVGPWNWYTNWGTMIAGIFSLAVFGLLLRVCFNNPLARDSGYLFHQIQQVAEGEKLDEAYRIPENSLLKEAENSLENIESAMKKSVEKQVQAERLKAELLTNMSHDLKTPLTSMVGYTDLLKQEELSDQARDYVEAIAAKQEQLKNMIQDLFDLSKASSGSEQLNLEILDMNRLLEQTLGDMEDAVTTSGRNIRQKFSQEPLPFLGDNLKMYRVVQNLLENALKYSLENTRIYIETQKQGDRILAEIKNIACYEMDFEPEEIMERFVRGDKARTTQGHGLGLAIASAYAANMGGTLHVEIDGDLFKVILEFPVTEEKGGSAYGQDFNRSTLLQ
ncbi:MAG TPA: HAMP domain-containing histidine kinase, partial [Candidatus Blautia stercoripullorum]|nr:HAMP domain-containing histidine kinase [Candidatus Blautia stercoripullorum]